jgi:hypothetical protein
MEKLILIKLEVAMKQLSIAVPGQNAKGARAIKMLVNSGYSAEVIARTDLLERLLHFTLLNKEHPARKTAAEALNALREKGHVLSLIEAERQLHSREQQTIDVESGRPSQEFALGTKPKSLANSTAERERRPRRMRKPEPLERG